MTADVCLPRVSGLVLVGLGPHAKRIYMHYFTQYRIRPDVVVELESQRGSVEEHFRGLGYRPRFVFVPDSSRDAETVPAATAAELRRLQIELRLSHVVVSTEPKAHLAYLRFFLESRMNVLTDKPITAPVGVSVSTDAASRIRSDYDQLAVLRSEAGVSFQVQCQRRWHEGYQFARRLVGETVARFGVPVTSIEIYHCDGMWNMPDEFTTRENHPYKYGYGKLLHSGYHFIDLLTWFESANAVLPHKRAESVELYTAPVRPADSFKVIGADDYRALLGTSRFEDWMDDAGMQRVQSYGEVDLHALAQFRCDGRTVTTATLNLVQSGFSRRAWHRLPPDTYKGNGRIRHERMNLQVGPLLNVQVHSYQSAEITDRGADRDDAVGGTEHFELYLFRNTELIGGLPFQRVSLQEITKPTGGGFLGFNEQARERALRHFLASCEHQLSDLSDHRRPIQLLAGAYQSLALRHAGRSPIVEVAL